MRFLSPSWFWMLLAIPICYVFVIYDEKLRLKKFSQFASKDVWNIISREANFGARAKKARVWLLAMGFAILAMARPQWGTHEETVHVSGLDIMLILDVSNSMEVEDVAPSRLKKAKHLIRSMVERLKGDRVGVVAFAGSAYVAAPLSTDLGYLLRAVEIIDPKVVSNQGTDIGLGLEVAEKALERGAEDVSAGHDGQAASSRVAILISDGEDHQEAAIEVAERLRTAGTKFYVFGVGTEKGGPIPIRDESGKLQTYKKDNRGQAVVSAFRPDPLLGLASAGGGRYWNVTSDGSEVEELLEDMGALNRTDYAERRYLAYEDRFQWPLAVALLLLLVEMALPARKLAAILVFCFCAGATAHSAPLGVYLGNEKGIKAYSEGKIDEAEKSFGAAQALSPTLPELEFNQSVVQMQKGDIEKSIQGFQKVIKESQKSPDKNSRELSVKSLYNLGGALTKKGDYKGAVNSYVDAIKIAKEINDSALEADARKNLELLVRQEEQQRKQSQREKDQKHESKDDNKSNDQAQSYKDTSREKRKREFKSQKLSDEDVERVMAELGNRERQLQTRLNKQRGKSQPNEKDW